AAPREDPEETLRVLMVRLWPRVRDGRETPEERASFFEHVMRLRAAAEGDDLRFLDAWNNAYEALAARELLGEPQSRELLAAYAVLLEAHAAR
ncbi:MAG: hypothetical protein M3340_12760, partial [Actinomycetota bacterium]|nr:hypothetical protein [Actinomycetota bacterium]